jgi:hypothetical protein
MEIKLFLEIYFIMTEIVLVKTISFTKIQRWAGYTLSLLSLMEIV